MRHPLITIDGPSASGKSSVSRLLAQKVGCPWVSTGAFYRGLALAAIEEKVDAKDEESLTKLVLSPIWEVKMTPQETHVFYQGKDVTERITGEDIGSTASRISQIPKVREALLQRQRDCFDPEKGLIAEGRDCGTVVFPQAQLKIYLTAGAAQRAQRRSDEQSADLEKTLEMQQKRDLRDTQRKQAPLKMAEGAVEIDSSFLSLEEVVDKIFNLIKP